MQKILMILTTIKTFFSPMFAFLWKHTVTAANFCYEYFAGRTLDVQIAIVITAMTILRVWFYNLNWFLIFCCFVAWFIVWRKEVTIPAITWVWNETLPIRRRFTVWSCKVLFNGYSFPIAMIGWGVLCFVLSGLSFYVSKDVSVMFGMGGFSGIIFGMFFYMISLHNKNVKIKAKQAKHLAKTAQNTPKTTP